MKSVNVKRSLRVMALASMTTLGVLCQLPVQAQSSSPAKATTELKTQVVKIISEDEAKQIAVKQVSGKAVDVAIEKKLGANRYVVEVRPEAGGKEVDVIIDMASGKVLAVEK